MDLASMLTPMLMQGGLGAVAQQPTPVPQMGTAQQQGSLAPFMDPQAMGQLAADTADYQRRNQIANALMSQGYVPNSGKFGAIAGIASMLGGALAQRGNSERLSDLVARQMQADSQAAAAKRQQDLEDLYNKTQIESGGKIQVAQGEAQAKKQFALPTYVPGIGTLDPSTGKITVDPNVANTEIATKKAEAWNQAAAEASHAGAAGAAALQQVQQVMALPDSPTKTAMLSKLLGEGGMQAMMFSGMGMGGGGGGAVGGGPAMSGPTGDDFLKMLNPALAGQVKAIAEGRQQPPTSMAMRSPMGQALMSAVNQYDPTFDATNYQARSKTRNDFTSGNAAKQVNAMNTAIGHAGTLLDAADALDNTSFPLLNRGLNAAAQATGDPRIQQFNTARDALAGEITKAFRGSAGSEKDIEELRNNLSAAGSPEQMKAAIGQAMKLLASKNESLADQYTKGFGNNSQPNFLDPHAQAALAKLQNRGIDIGSLGTDEGVSNAAPAAGQLSDADLLKKYGGG